MAEEEFKKLEEQLNCSICLDIYTDPKLLQCCHIYCQQCLVPLGVQDQQGQLGLTCPACRQVTPIPATGVAGLQSAFHINCFLKIREFLQKKLENPVATPEGAVGGATMDAPSRNVIGHCFEHPEEELILYCETCGELVCIQCSLKGGKHHDHDCARLKKAFKKYQEEITASLEPMKNQVVTIMKALAELDTRCGEISDKRAAVQDKIRITFKRLREVLNVRETELISKLDQMTQVKLKGLSAQKDQIETTLAQLSSCLHFMKESLQPGNEGEVLMMKTNTVEQVKELTTPFQPDTLKPNTEADIAFSAPADMITVCQNYGQVLLAKYLPDPSQCHVKGKGAEVAAIGEKFTAILQAISFESKPCEEPIESLECGLVSEITGTRASCSVERRGQSKYKISYQPTIKGRHQLHIKTEGQHVRGSPLSIAVNSTVKNLGTRILTISGVRGPEGIAINQRGEVVVSEGEKHCVSVLSPSGERLRSFGTLGSGQGQFYRPRGIVVDGEGNILVVDMGNHRIQKFTPEGQFLTAVGTEGSGPLQFDNPIDITLHASNNKVYVVDRNNFRVQILNSDLTFTRTFGKDGIGIYKGQFIMPCGIACDDSGMVYVVESNSHRIQVFTAEGKFLRTFGRHGQGRGDLGRPHAITIDTSDMVYISEWDNHRVSVFTSEGQYLTSFGDFMRPHGLAVNNSGVVYVCDYKNNCVQIF